MRVVASRAPRNLRRISARILLVDESDDMESPEGNVVALASEMVLLDYVLPNGKMLRDSTFGECAEAGGWLTRLSKRGQAGDKVGAVLSEQDVRAIRADA